MPDASCTGSLVRKVESTRVSHHRYSRIHPAFPHAMVLTVSFVLVIGLYCHRRLADVVCLRPAGPTCLRWT
jgi:hypothetical protein